MTTVTKTTSEKKRKVVDKRSWVYEHCKQHPALVGTNDKLVCNYCFKVLAAKGGNTSGIKRHLGLHEISGDSCKRRKLADAEFAQGEAEFEDDDSADEAENCEQETTAEKNGKKLNILTCSNLNLYFKF
jgi:hypothetical protein